MMKKSPRIFVYLSFLFLFTATFCENTDEGVPISCDERLENLNELSNEIDTLIGTSQCSDAFECRAIAFGTKPCGGPWEYLIYTTSIDTLQLENLVEEYNALEANYNLNCDVGSDCMFVTAPIGFECENNICIPLQ